MASSTFSNPTRLLLESPKHDRDLLPVPRRQGRLLAQPPGRTARLFRTVVDRSADLAVVSEFRSKLRVAEDLINKLAYNLREIQGARQKPQDKPKQSSAASTMVRLKNFVRGSGGENSK